MATAGFVHANGISQADSPILTIGMTDRVRLPDDTSRSVLEDHAGLNDSKEVNQPILITIKYGASFFGRVTTGLLAIHKELACEEENLTKMCNAISVAISQAIKHDSRRDELYTWRAILGLWDEVQVSGSRRDSDRGVLRLETASARFQLFCAQLESRKLAENLHV